jgi:hypothetical protein
MPEIILSFVVGKKYKKTKYSRIEKAIKIVQPFNSFAQKFFLFFLKTCILTFQFFWLFVEAILVELLICALLIV